MSQMESKPSQQGPINMNMNNISMPGAGTPAGMDHAAALPRAGSSERQVLNTYIYDYFIKNDMMDCAKALLKNPTSEVQFDGNYRHSPSNRPKQETDMNGVDDDAMDSGDGRENGEDAKNIKDLPPAKVPPHQGSFLLEWWCCFMDIYWARNKNSQASNAATAYVNNAQVRVPLVRCRVLPVQ